MTGIRYLNLEILLALLDFPPPVQGLQYRLQLEDLHLVILFSEDYLQATESLNWAKNYCFFFIQQYKQFLVIKYLRQ